MLRWSSKNKSTQQQRGVFTWQPTTIASDGPPPYSAKPNRDDRLRITFTQQKKIQDKKCLESVNYFILPCAAPYNFAFCILHFAFILRSNGQYHHVALRRLFFRARRHILQKASAEGFLRPLFLSFRWQGICFL